MVNPLQTPRYYHPYIVNLLSTIINLIIVKIYSKMNLKKLKYTVKNYE